MKNPLYLLLFFCGIVLSQSCDNPKDDKKTTDPTTKETATAELGGSIGTRSLSADTIYTIDRFAYVADGNVLTIPAGTILKAKTGNGADASALIVSRGGKIIANGTATSPVIFTSEDDDIAVGETQSTLNPATDAGKWGGLIILGKAPISAGSSTQTNTEGTEASIEGVPSKFEFSKYGGTVTDDNSGTLSYVSIRFTGTQLSSNNEIQGLTLGGIGSGTSISNIEILSSNDDGIELFGGSVNVTNVLVAYQNDDGLDIDQNYSGTIDQVLVLNYNPEKGNDGFEIDGPESSTNNTGKFTIKNTTVINRGTQNSRAARLKSGAQGTITNCAFLDFTNYWIYVDGGSATANYVAEDLKVTNSEFDLSTLAEGIDASNEATAINNLFTATEAGNSAKTSGFTKGTTADFSWTEANRLKLLP